MVVHQLQSLEMDCSKLSSTRIDDFIHEHNLLWGTIYLCDQWVALNNRFLKSLKQIGEKKERIHQDSWRYFWFICPNRCQAVGVGAYQKCHPLGGHFELKFEVIPDYRNQGYGKVLVKKLIELVFHNQEAVGLFAKTPPYRSAAERVIEQCGFTKLAFCKDENHKGYWLWMWQSIANEWLVFHDPAIWN